MMHPSGRGLFTCCLRERERERRAGACVRYVEGGSTRISKQIETGVPDCMTPTRTALHPPPLYTMAYDRPVPLPPPLRPAPHQHHHLTHHPQRPTAAILAAPFSFPPLTFDGGIFICASSSLAHVRNSASYVLRAFHIAAHLSRGLITTC
jgi:hypothetical protein